jgi:hypothetical protein
MLTTNFINTHPGWSITYFFLIVYEMRAPPLLLNAHCGNLLCRDHASCMWMDERHLRRIIKWVIRVDAIVCTKGWHILCYYQDSFYFSPRRRSRCHCVLSGKKDNVPWKLSLCAWTIKCIKKLINRPRRNHTHTLKHTYLCLFSVCKRIAHARINNWWDTHTPSCIFSWNQMCSCWEPLSAVPAGY